MSEILKELARGLKTITSAQVERCRSLLTPPEPGETLIATVTDPEAHRLWALATEYERQQHMAAHAARYDTSSAKERQELCQAASRFQALEEITRSIAWLRLRDAAHYTYDAGTIGLRENFSLVKTTSEQEDLLKNGIPIPTQLLTGLFQRLRQAREKEPEPEETKKPKPQ